MLILELIMQLIKTCYVSRLISIAPLVLLSQDLLYLVRPVEYLPIMLWQYNLRCVLKLVYAVCYAWYDTYSSNISTCIVLWQEGCDTRKSTCRTWGRKWTMWKVWYRVHYHKIPYFNININVSRSGSLQPNQIQSNKANPRLHVYNNIGDLASSIDYAYTALSCDEPTRTVNRMSSVGLLSLGIYATFTSYALDSQS